MKYLLLIFTLFIHVTYAFDSIEVLNPNITIHKSGYFKTDQTLSPEQALSQNFKPLPKKAVSFGFDHSTYWFVFEVSTSLNEPIYLDSKSIISDYQTLYAYENNKLLKTTFNGYFVPIKNRDINIFPIRFLLENNTNKTTYLLKLTSKSPIYTSFSLGTASDVDETWDWLFIIIIFTVSTSFAFTIYNLFLYFITNDRAYIFYCVYIIGFLGLNFIGLGYPPLLPFFDVQDAYYYFLISVLIKITGLTFFATYFLQLKERQPILRKVFFLLLTINIVLGILYALRIAQPFFALSVQTIMLFSIFVGIKSYLSHYKPAIFYLAATGIGNGLFLGFMLMNQGNGVTYSILTLNLSNIALVWDLIMFSLALAYRIKLLREENTKNERLAIMKSRQKVIGELTGNIAHQWRQPLNTFGAIISYVEAKSKYSQISNEELLKSCQAANAILRHLSETINTLQDFFVDQQERNELFDLNQQIRDLIAFLEDSMKTHHIKIHFHPEKTLFLESNQNLISQVIMNLLLNAKDVLVANNDNVKKYIQISTDIQEHYAIIQIVDNGGGITTEPIEKIFEPFTSTKTNGSGIGLYLARNIIEKLDGTLSAENYQKGAKFTISLPISTKYYSENA